MKTAIAESFLPSVVESRYEPLDASLQLYDFDDIKEAAPYFSLADRPVQLRCVGLEENCDGYNPSGIHDIKVFKDDDRYTKVAIVRTEKDSGAYSAESRFCRYDDSGELTEIPIERRPWEDAAVCTLADGRVVTSGVRVIWNEDDPTVHDRFFTEYYIGPTLDSQTYLGQSPDGHKDSRLSVIDDQIVLWTRPQQRCFEGKINYTTLDSIEELQGERNELGEYVAQQVYDRCKPVGAGVFAEGTWGGPNGVVDVGGGWALVQCHVSRAIPESLTAQSEHVHAINAQHVLEYDGFMLLHHPSSGKAYIFGSHVSEKQFPQGDAKWPKVRKVAFPGGLHDVCIESNGNITGKATFGVRDKDMYMVRWKTASSLARFIFSETL